MPPYTRPQLLEAFRIDHPELRNVDDNKLFAAIAVDHPDIAQGISELKTPTQVSDDRTAPRVAMDQTVETLKGLVTGPIMGLAGAVKEIPGLAKDVVTGDAMSATKKAGGLLSGAYDMVAKPVENITQNAAAYIAPDKFQAPSREQNEEAANVAGQNLGNLIAPKVVGGTVSRLKNAMTVPSVPQFTKTFAKSGDINFQKYAPGVLDELKASGPIDTVEEGLEALKKRHDVYEGGVKHYLDPHKNIPAEEYRSMIRNKAIQAIPETATRAERIRMLRLIDERIPKELTVGKIDTLRKESNARIRTANLNVTKGIAADVTTQAVEEALAGGARNAVSNILDTKGLGGGEAVRQLHGRIGTIMHGEDALLGKLNQAVGERAITPIERVKNKVSRITSEIPGVKTAAHWTGYEKYAQGAPMTIDEALKAAIKSHKSMPSEITSQLRATPGPHFQRMADRQPSMPVQGELSEMAPYDAGSPNLFEMDITGAPPQYPHGGLNFQLQPGIEQTPYKPAPVVNPMHEITPGGLSYPKTQTEIYLERLANRNPDIVSRLKSVRKLGR